MPIQEIKRQANFLANENRKADPDIVGVYWFPDEEEVRLVELVTSALEADDGAVHAFHFLADPKADLPLPSGIAHIRPEEFGKLRLPRNWGEWKAAVRLSDEGENL